MRLPEKSANGTENHSYLQKMWKQEKVQSFKEFLHWHNNNDVVPTLEAIQKFVEFHDNKCAHMLKLECRLPNLGNKCLQNSIIGKFYPFTQSDGKLLLKVREDVVEGMSVVLIRKTFVDEIDILISKKICKSMVEIHASQF